MAVKCSFFILCFFFYVRLLVCRVKNIYKPLFLCRIHLLPACSAAYSLSLLNNVKLSQLNYLSASAYNCIHRIMQFRCDELMAGATGGCEGNVHMFLST